MTGFTHLEFYTKHGISPVHYSKTELNDHLTRRSSLYRNLGLLPITVKGSSVLEVAAGSGQNSLYLSTLEPKSLSLVEPNPTGFSEIQELYAINNGPKFTQPVIFNTTLQEFNPNNKFDIVVCENWLRRVPAERDLLKKLSGFVVSGGILVVTTVPAIGLLANMIRRSLIVKFCDVSFYNDR